MKGGPGRALPTDERGDSMEANGNFPPSGSGKMLSVNVSSEGVFGTRFRESIIPEGAFGAGLREHVTGSEFHPSGPILGAGPVLDGVPPTIRPALIPGISTLGTITGGLVSAFSRRIGVGEIEGERSGICSPISAVPEGSVSAWRGRFGSRVRITGSS